MSPCLAPSFWTTVLSLLMPAVVQAGFVPLPRNVTQFWSRNYPDISVSYLEVRCLQKQASYNTNPFWVSIGIQPYLYSLDVDM